jgi:hypothetical protein
MIRMKRISTQRRSFLNLLRAVRLNIRLLPAPIIGACSLAVKRKRRSIPPCETPVLEPGSLYSVRYFPQ